MAKSRFWIFGIISLITGLTVGTGYTNDKNKPLENKKIVIDAGHGGEDPGAVDPELYLKEKDVTLPVSLMLKALLESAGATVIMTRESDVFISPEQRAKIANDANADYFISIHFNAGKEGDHKTNYTRACYYPGSTVGEELATILQQYLHDALGIPQSGPTAENFQVLRETRHRGISQIIKKIRESQSKSEQSV